LCSANLLLTTSGKISSQCGLPEEVSFRKVKEMVDEPPLILDAFPYAKPVKRYCHYGRTLFLVSFFQKKIKFVFPDSFCFRKFGKFSKKNHLCYYLDIL
jgi:hypothetical protein